MGLREISPVHDDPRFKLKTDHKPLEAIFPQRPNPVSESTQLVLLLNLYGLKVMRLHGQEQVFVIRSLATKLLVP